MTIGALKPRLARWFVVADVVYIRLERTMLVDNLSKTILSKRKLLTDIVGY